jgi:hypothetical protein
MLKFAIMKKSLVLSLFLALLSIAALGQTSTKPQSKYNRAGFDAKLICEHQENPFSCARKMENKLGTIYRDLIKRSNDKLVVVTLANGTKKSFRDVFESDDDPNTVRYSVVDFIEDINAYLVKVSYYEGEAYQMINRASGTKYELPGPPVVSPDGKKFVAFSDDPSGEYNPHSLQIWNVTKSSFTKAYDLKNKPWGVKTAKWNSNSSVRINPVRMDDFREIDMKPKTLSMSTGKWVVN